MSIESPPFKAPCEVKTTSCQKSAHVPLPCWLKGADKCPPLNSHKSRVKKGYNPEISEQLSVIDAHFTCPFTTNAFFNETGDDDVDVLRELFRQRGHIEAENAARFGELVVFDLKTGNIEDPLINPHKRDY